MQVLRDIIKNIKPVTIKELATFQGGLVGHVNYDLVRKWGYLPEISPEDTVMPEALFTASKRLIVFDHLTHQIKVIAFAHLRENDDLKEIYDLACEEVGETIAELQRPLSSMSEKAPFSLTDFESNFNRDDFNESVRKAKEHIMLVDLGRNDVGKVAMPGSVTVPRLMEVEHYSHVMHIVTRLEGLLKPQMDGFDLFMATFPAGTVTGAPKIRAMEIISELEPSSRGPYAGAVGYFGFNGNMDFCITIRTISIVENRLSVQVGAGIMYDSSPEKEYEETLKKAGAMFKAIERSKNDSDDR